MDHREIAVRVPVMNEVQFLFPFEPCKPLKSRSHVPVIASACFFPGAKVMPIFPYPGLLATSSIRSGCVWLEPISKSPEEDNEAGELNEAKEVLWMIFPSDEEPALPLDPGEEAFDQPAPQEASQAAPVLRRRLRSVRAVRRDHLDAILT